MKKYSITVAAVLLLACFAYGETGVAFFSDMTDRGVVMERIIGEYTPTADPQPMNYPPELLWHYIDETGCYPGMAPMGDESGYVFSGGYYEEARMFQGVTGDGSVLWSYEPAEFCKETGTVAAATADIFYSVFSWDGNCNISCFNSQSADTPAWTYEATDTIDPGWVSWPGTIACSEDGSVLAVGGLVEGHLTIQFFSSSDTDPFLIYEDESTATIGQLRITADGSKCIFRNSTNLYRLDIATGTLEASCTIDSWGPSLGISPDGSVVAFGYASSGIIVWDGSAYNLEAVVSFPGYACVAATVAADNNTVYFGFTKSGNVTNKIMRYDLDTSSEVWTYDYTEGSGDYQEWVSWMDCSDDGRWLAVASFGLQRGGGAEVNVFDDLNPGTPCFSMDTPGSAFHVDISSDGRYVTAATKSAHANEYSSGGDYYFAEMDITGIESGGTVSTSELLISPNPSSGSFSAAFSAAEPCDVSIELFDLSGRLVYSESSRITQMGNASIQLATDLPSGIYSCRLSAGSEENTARVVIAR